MPRTTRWAISWLFWLLAIVFVTFLPRVISATEFQTFESVEISSVDGQNIEPLFEPIDSKWTKVPVAYCVTDQRLENVVKLAFEKWRDDPNSTFDVKYTGLCDRVDINNGRNEIGFWSAGDKEQPENPFTLKDNLGGVTFSYWYISNQVPPVRAEADILFRDWDTVQRVPALILHETGHFVGLTHSDNPTAVMFPVLNVNSPNELTSEDSMGIQQLYPRPFPPPGSMAKWEFEIGELKVTPNYLIGVYLWDGRRWLRWYPNVPSYANSLQLEAGKTYWVLFK